MQENRLMLTAALVLAAIASADAEHGAGQGHGDAGHSAGHGHGHGGDSWKKPLYMDEIWVLTSVILLLGVTYEHLEHTLKHSVPHTYKVVVDSMLNELAALGFVATATFVITHPGEGGGSFFQKFLDKASEGMGTTFAHMLHDYETLHFGLFFVVNFYFIQVMFVVGTITSKYSRERAAKLLFGHLDADASIDTLPAELADLSNTWEDASARIALLQAMQYKQKGGGMLSKLGRMLFFDRQGTDPAPWMGFPWQYFGELKLLFTETNAGSRTNLAELFLFRESMRKKLARWNRDTKENSKTHNKADGNIGLPFLEYFEKSVSETLGKLVRLELVDWIGVWVAMTAFTSATRYMRSVGYSASEAKAVVYCFSQLLVLVGGYMLFTTLARIKEMLRPRLSKKATALIHQFEKTGEVPQDPALWDSHALLDLPPYLSLPDREETLGVGAVVRDHVRYIFGFQKPGHLSGHTGGGSGINKQHLLFGWFGSSGARWMSFFVKWTFLSSTILVAANLSAIEQELLMRYLDDNKSGLIQDQYIDYRYLPAFIQTPRFQAGIARFVSLVPYLLIFAIMPGLVVKLTLVTETQELTNSNRIKKCLAARERHHFVAALKALLSFLMLFRDSENNMEAKLSILRKHQKESTDKLIERRSSEEDLRLLSAHSHEELGLLEAIFLRGTGDAKHHHDHGYTLNLTQVEKVLTDMGLGLNKEDTLLIFKFMDRQARGKVGFSEFASAVLLPVKGLPGSQTLGEGHSARDLYAAPHNDGTHHGKQSEFNPNEIADRTCDHFFKLLDENGDGTVVLSEFQNVMSRVFPSWTPASLVPLFRELDSDNTGDITKETLRAWVRKAMSSTPLGHGEDHGHH